ncbi:putative myosin heavy chain [Tribonema minus]|uniref:Putative myosin heavy chain n=1 Tax=Tribonema minus TaxID=303371 RepID=A0A835Z8J0_9STRA|nr:putative myosin heavy chain [Tribonema minus]
MGRVREEHTHIQSVLGTLNSKISAVLSKQEGDFLAAYRAHMYTVQKELQSLRQRVVDAEKALQRNDKVQRLEDACEWYRREALRLDSFNSAMKKDLKRMGDKVAVLGRYLSLPFVVDSCSLLRTCLGFSM